MPCNDVTELIRVVVDDADRLTDYRFIKRSCGRGVGADSLLQEALAGKTVQEILAQEPEAFLEAFAVPDGVEEFLHLKHLIALQSTLEVLTGMAAGGPNDVCAAAEIAFEDGNVIIEARLSVDLMTEKIASCGACGTACGRKKKRTAPIQFV